MLQSVPHNGIYFRKMLLVTPWRGWPWQKSPFASTHIFCSCISSSFPLSPIPPLPSSSIQTLSSFRSGSSSHVHSIHSTHRFFINSHYPILVSDQTTSGWNTNPVLFFLKLHIIAIIIIKILVVCSVGYCSHYRHACYDVRIHEVFFILVLVIFLHCFEGQL